MTELPFLIPTPGTCLAGSTILIHFISCIYGWEWTKGQYHITPDRPWTNAHSVSWQSHAPTDKLEFREMECMPSLKKEQVHHLVLLPIVSSLWHEFLTILPSRIQLSHSVWRPDSEWHTNLWKRSSVLSAQKHFEIMDAWCEYDPSVSNFLFTKFLFDELTDKVPSKLLSPFPKMWRQTPPIKIPINGRCIWVTCVNVIAPSGTNAILFVPLFR